MIGFPGSSAGKISACRVRDPSSILGSKRSSEEGKGNPLQYYYLKNPMDRGTWWVIVYEFAKELDMTEHT